MPTIPSRLTRTIRHPQLRPRRSWSRLSADHDRRHYHVVDQAQPEQALTGGYQHQRRHHAAGAPVDGNPPIPGRICLGI